MGDEGGMMSLLTLGGPAIWLILFLSILMLAIILWKIWQFSKLGVWSSGGAEFAIEHAEAGQPTDLPRTALGQVMRTAIKMRNSSRDKAAKREEIARVARNTLARTRSGLRLLELIASIAPLIGLLGTVLGMIDAFQSLASTGAQADPGALAGGIWEALLTTAAGMAVAIPASAALTWFDGRVDGLRLAMEDAATRIINGPGANA